ncbi:phosphopantetheine-binding protein [Paenibacillus rhizoplanae]
MEKPSLEEEDEAGEEEMEKRLLHVWRHLLKRQNIGVNDHFYAVGGDSILAIQSVSMARDQGIVFTPRQLADNPSVKELAAVATWKDSEEPKEKDIDWEGEFGLTPIQHWFFSRSGLKSRIISISLICWCSTIAMLRSWSQPSTV